MREDWVKCTLGDFMEHKGNSLNPKNYLTETFELFSVPNHAIKKPEIKKGKEIGSSKQVVGNNWVLLSRINPHLNRSWVIKSDSTLTKIASSEWVKFPPCAALSPEYIGYFLTNTELKNYMCLNVSGVGGSLTRTNKNAISVFPFPLPPLPIQRAIVTKIESLFTHLDSGIADLKKAQAQLKIYRQAVLKKAFEGELTKDWRAQQTDLPSAEELLELIKEERQKHYEQQLEDWKNAVEVWEENGKEGKRPTKPRKLTVIPPISEEEFESLSKLPSSMAWIRLGNIVWSVKDGPHYSPEYSDSGIPFISGGNIRPEGIDFKNVKYISSELHLKLSERCKPNLNDILYTKGGTTGIARVNTYDKEFNVWVHVAVLKTVKSIIPFYLQHVLNSSHCYKQSQKYTHGVGNQDLGLTRMILITLPICSQKEQHQIVQEIESRLSVCDKVEESITESLEKAKALRQSILKKAFEGKLLSKEEIATCKQAPDYEPASVLLEKIKAEKAAQVSKSKKQKKR